MNISGLAGVGLTPAEAVAFVCGIRGEGRSRLCPIYVGIKSRG